MLSEMNSAVSSFKAVMLLGFIVLIGTLMGGVFAPITGDALTSWIAWGVILTSAVLLAVRTAWRGRVGETDKVERFDGACYDALSIFGGIYILALGLFCLRDTLAKNPDDTKGLAIFGGITVVGIGAVAYGVYRYVRYFKQFTSVDAGPRTKG